MKIRSNAPISCVACGSDKVRIVIASKEAEGIVVKDGVVQSLPSHISGRAECQDCGVAYSLNDLEYEIVEPQVTASGEAYIEEKPIPKGDASSLS